MMCFAGERMSFFVLLVSCCLGVLANKHEYTQMDIDCLFHDVSPAWVEKTLGIKVGEGTHDHEEKLQPLIRPWMRKIIYNISRHILVTAGNVAIKSEGDREQKDDELSCGRKSSRELIKAKSIIRTLAKHLNNSAVKPSLRTLARKRRNAKRHKIEQRRQRDYSSRKRSRIQADDSSLLATTALTRQGNSTPSSSTNQLDNSKNILLHYEDYIRLKDSKDPLDSYAPNNFLTAGRSKPAEEVNNGVKFPETIVKNGTVFYRHDAVKEEENLPKFLTKNSEQSIHKEQLESYNNHYNIPVNSGFDFIVGSQQMADPQPIATAFARKNSKSTPTHVTGMANKDRHFATSAQFSENGEAVASSLVERGHQSTVLIPSIEHAYNGEQSSIKKFINAEANDWQDKFVDMTPTEKMSHTAIGKNEHLSSIFKNPNSNYSLPLPLPNSDLTETYTKTLYHGDSVDFNGIASQSHDSNDIIDQGGLLNGFGSPLRESDVAQVLLGHYEEGGSDPNSGKEGAVGLVTFPFAEIGRPPGPGELVQQMQQFQHEERNIETPVTLLSEHASKYGANSENDTHIKLFPFDDALTNGQRMDKILQQQSTLQIDNRNHSSSSDHISEDNLDIPEDTQIQMQEVIIPMRLPTNSWMDSEESVIPPLEEGSSQILQPAVGSGQPVINIITMRKNGKINPILQRQFPSLQPGQKIPGMPGFRVPPGFRGRVILGKTLPVEIDSRKIINGYNANVKVRTQYPPPDHTVYATVSGPGSSKYLSRANHPPGIHVTLGTSYSATPEIYHRNPPLSQHHRSHRNQPTDLVSSYSSQNKHSSNARNEKSHSYKVPQSWRRAQTSSQGSHSWNNRNDYSQLKNTFTSKRSRPCRYLCQAINGPHQTRGI